MVNGRSEVITIVTGVFFGLSLATVSLRCFVRLRVVKAFGWDDGLMVLAMALNTAFAVCGFMGAYYGMGKRIEYFLPQPDHFRLALLCWFLGQVFYVITCIVAKISIILTLLRITVNRIHIAILYATMSLAIIVGLLFLFFTVFQCSPVNHFWDRFSESGKCIDVNILIDIAYVYSVGAAVTDFTIGLLPAFMIWNLRMGRREKVAVAGILGLGCMFVFPSPSIISSSQGLTHDNSASAAVIVRIPYLQHYADIQFLYRTTNISIWSNIEAGLGITAGSLTTLRPLIRFFREVSSGSRSYSRNPGSFPLSSTLNNTPYHQSKVDQDDAQRLWMGPVENDNYHGVRTVVLGNGRVAAAPVSSSEEELNPHGQPGNTTTVMESRELGRMGKRG